MADKQNPGTDPTSPAWADAHLGPGATGTGPESDVPSDVEAATSAEMRAAGEKSLSHDAPGNERGDLGDSGPGED